MALTQPGQRHMDAKIGCASTIAHLGGKVRVYDLGASELLKFPRIVLEQHETPALNMSTRGDEEALRLQIFIHLLGDPG